MKKRPGNVTGATRGGQEWLRWPRKSSEKTDAAAERGGQPQEEPLGREEPVQRPGVGRVGVF